jgi:hypothetical protein
MPPVNHSLNHPDIHSPWSEWSEDQTLHVAVCYSNPFRWRTRRELANDCIRHLAGSPNVKLYVGELAYGARPFELTQGNDEAEFPEDAQNALQRERRYNNSASPNDPSRITSIRLRTTSELFHKENILNSVIRSFPPNWKYGAYVDADFHLTRHDWALETIHQLQHYDFVQPFSTYTDLSGETYGTGHLPIRNNTGFAFTYIQNGYRLPDGFSNGGWRTPGGNDHYYGAVGGPRGVGATGGMWAFRRTAFDTVGGLLDKCILGHGDWFMTFGLVGEEAPDMHVDGYTEDYRKAILAWQANAAKLKKNVGYVDCHAIHHFHGSKTRRAYSSRDQILVRNKFAPTTDLKPDWQGIYQLTPDKPGLRDDIRRYFLSRTEDDPNLYGSERPLV